MAEKAIGDLIYEEYRSKLLSDSKLKSIAKSLKKSASHADAEKYAARAGDILSKILQSWVNAGNFPAGDESAIARILTPALQLQHDAVSQAAQLVQKNLNIKSGLGLKPIVPKFDKSTAFNIAKKMANYETFDEAEWMFGEPMTTTALDVADNALRANAEFQSRAGLRAKVIRTAEYGACEWCQALEGEYDYDEVKDRGNPVWQRHNNCRCEIEFITAEGESRFL